MNIEKEDVISVIVTLLLLGVWFITLSIYNYPLISVLILWIGMIILSIAYFYVYKKKNKDNRIFKIRFLVSAVPIYPVLIYYVYSISIGNGLAGKLRFIPFFVIFLMIILNASVVYYYDKKNDSFSPVN
jgi:LPXTG-motif cell wall-anchored protein